MYFLAALIGLSTLTGCSAPSTSESNELNAQAAIKLVKQVCNGELNLEWSERASLASQANYLDKRWRRLAEATAYQSALKPISELQASNKGLADYPEPYLDFLYEYKIQYSKFVAECSILDFLEKKSEKATEKD